MKGMRASSEQKKKMLAVLNREAEAQAQAQSQSVEAPAAAGECDKGIDICHRCPDMLLLRVCDRE